MWRVHLCHHHIIRELVQVGYVFCNQSGRYAGSGGGWRSDPLLPVTDDGFTVPTSTAQSIWITLHVPSDATPGMYTGSVDLILSSSTSITIPVTVNVWNITLPTLRQSHIGTAWSGAWTPEYFAPYYGSQWNATAWYNLFVQHRMPPDSIYLSTPRPMSDLVYLASAGANYFALIDVNALSTEEGVSVLSGDDDACPYNYTQSYVDLLIATLQPTVDQLRALNISQYAYVYGFDEEPATCADQVRPCT